MAKKPKLPKLPKYLYWQKGSPFIWYGFTIRGVRFRDSTETNDPKLAQDRLTFERNKQLTSDYIKHENTLALTKAFADYWMERARFNKSSPSIKAHIEHMLNYYGEHRALHSIGQAEKAAYVAHCRTERFVREYYHPTLKKMVKGKTAKPVSNATINRRIATFQGMHREAWETWGVKVQPINFKRLKLQEADIVNNTLIDSEAQRFLDAASPHLRDFIMIGLYTGLRKGNILSLRGNQIDMERREITVRAKSRKQEGKVHTVPIVDELAHYILAGGLHKRDHVITFEGKPVKDIRSAWAGALKRAKVKKIRRHDLRHTCGTWLRKRTKDMKLVKEWLGHADYKTTDRYAHMDMDDMRETANDASLPKFRLIR